VQRRLATAAGPNLPAEFGIVDEFALLGSFVAGPKALAQFAGGAMANTDDHPVVAYQAPRITYVPDSLPGDRLLALLHEFSIAPTDVIGAATDATQTTRLAAYWAARTRFIEAGRHVRPSSDAREMLAQVHEPLLAVLRTSPDFRPAYDPLLRMATALARTDVPAARALLTELSAATPERTEARSALRQLAGGAP
jgi:spermidine synthase